MPQTVLSLAKTTQPTLSMVVERARLFSRFDDRAGSRAVWISAAPGSGKTTCIASYLQSCGRRALWYQLDSTDADVATFFFYLRQSAIKHSPQSGHALPDVPADGADWRKFGRQLFRAIFARFGEPMVVVFDNCESIPAQSQLHSALAAALEEVPAGSMLVFVSRADPPPPFARALANGVLVQLEGAELALSLEEFRQLARLRGMTVRDADLERIHQHSSGWVTGAILMLELARKFPDLKRPPVQSSGALLYDYVAQEVFAGFDNSLRVFLLRVCWPSRLGVRVAETLGDEPRARQLLGNLARNNYFVTERVDAQECEYILHPLLRDFLRAQSLKLLGSATVAELQRRTAALLADDGQVEEAVELLSDNMDWKPLEDLIARHAEMLVRQGRTELLSSWLGKLPPDRLNGNGWLTYWRGKARLRHSAREARRCFESAFRCFQVQAQPSADGQRLACLGTIEAILLEMDDFSLLDPWISSLQELLAQGHDTSAPDAGAATEVTLLAALALRNPRHEDLTGRFHACEQAVMLETDEGARIEHLLWLIQSCLLCGELGRAGGLLSGVHKSPAARMNQRMALRLSLLTALHALLCGDGEAAQAAAEQCFTAAEHSARHLLPLIAACRDAAAITLGTVSDAGEADPDAAPGMETTNRLARFFAHYLASWKALIADDVMTAHHEQKAALACAAELGIPFLEVLSGCAYAQLLSRCEDARGCAAQLRRVHSIARDMQNPMLEFMTLLIYSEVALGEGRNTSGVNAIRYALGLGRQHAYYHVPWWRGAQLADLLAAALRHGIETDYVRDFIRRRDLRPDSSPVDIPDWPWPLRIATLGQLSILDSSNREICAGRIKGRPLQVLKVLLAAGARDVPAERVAETLWPHVDIEYGNKSLTINLHRLRRLLGNEDAILLRDGRLSINAALVWVDLFALEALLGRIAAGPHGTDEAFADGEVTRNAERLAALCRGPFLQGDDEFPCFAERRERCRAAIESVAELAPSGEPGGIYRKLADAAGAKPS